MRVSHIEVEHYSILCILVYISILDFYSSGFICSHHDWTVVLYPSKKACLALKVKSTKIKTASCDFVFEVVKPQLLYLKFRRCLFNFDNGSMDRNWNPMRLGEGGGICVGMKAEWGGGGGGGETIMPDATLSPILCFRADSLCSCCMWLWMSVDSSYAVHSDYPPNWLQHCLVLTWLVYCCCLHDIMHAVLFMTWADCKLCLELTFCNWTGTLWIQFIIKC